jgi:hypothetical protein
MEYLLVWFLKGKESIKWLVDIGEPIIVAKRFYAMY